MIPLWVILALLTAFAVSSMDACVKRFFSHLSVYEMMGYPLFYSLPLFAAAFPFIAIPELDSTFWWCWFLSIPLNGVGFLLYNRAIQISPLSLTVPYLAFTPAFMIITGYLILGEVPSLQGLLGILVVCAGGYTLNIDPRRWSLLSPLKAVFSETGSWIMLLVSFIFSFGAVVGKLAILHSSPTFFVLFFFGSFNLLFILLTRAAGLIRVRSFFEYPLKGLGAGALYFAHMFFHSWAISLVQASYMISVKRMSVVFGVIYGKFVFKEENIVFRFSGAVLMVIGTLLITLQGM